MKLKITKKAFIDSVSKYEGAEISSDYRYKLTLKKVTLVVEGRGGQKIDLGSTTQQPHESHYEFMMRHHKREDVAYKWLAEAVKYKAENSIESVWLVPF